MGLHPFHFRLGADTPNWKFLNISCSCSWVMGTLSLRWLCVVIWNPGGLNMKWFRKKYYCNMRSQIWSQGQKSRLKRWKYLDKMLSALSWYPKNSLKRLYTPPVQEELRTLLGKRDFTSARAAFRFHATYETNLFSTRPGWITTPVLWGSS